MNNKMISSQRRNRPAKTFIGAMWALKLRIMIKRDREDNPDAYICYTCKRPDYIGDHTACSPDWLRFQEAA